MQTGTQEGAGVSCNVTERSTFCLGGHLLWFLVMPPCSVFLYICLCFNCRAIPGGCVYAARGWSSVCVCVFLMVSWGWCHLNCKGILLDLLWRTIFKLSQQWGGTHSAVVCSQPASHPASLGHWRVLSMAQLRAALCR